MMNPHNGNNRYANNNRRYDQNNFNSHINLYTINDEIVNLDPTQLQMINDAQRDRKVALSIAEPYLKRRGDIWGNMQLSNPLCSIYLSKDGTQIKAYNKLRGKNNCYCEFDTEMSALNHVEMWNFFCMNFSQRLMYEELIKLSRDSGIKFTLYGDSEEDIFGKNSNGLQMPLLNETKSDVISLPDKNLQQVDINNCELKDITALPGINIISAKKLIKKREEINGFKSIEDVFSCIKITEHMQKQLKDQIIINEMKGAKTFKRNEERDLDL